MFNFDAAYDRLERRANDLNDDEDPVVKDGETVRMSMRFMDALQKSVALSRPGFVALGDEDTAQQLAAYQRYEDRLTSRWQGNDDEAPPAPLGDQGKPPVNVTDVSGAYDAYDKKLAERWKGAQ